MKGKNNTIYICHLCKFKTNDSSNLVTHLKHTNHNIKKSIKKNAFNCLSKKKNFKLLKANLYVKLYILKKLIITKIF